MDIGNAKVGIAISISVFDEFLKELHLKEIFPNRIPVDPEESGLGDMGDDVSMELTLEPPAFVLIQRGDGERYTRLELKGVLEIRSSSSTADGPPTQSIPLSAKILLGFELRPRSLDTPVLGLKYRGVQDVSFPLEEKHIDDLFARPEIAAIINGVTFDIVTPMVMGLEPVYFPDDQPVLTPTRDRWPVELRLMRGEDGHVDTVCIFVGLPGEDADPGDISSLVPELTEFGIVYSRSMMDKALEEGARRLTGQSFSGAKITGLKLHMEDTAIRIWGQAEKDDAVTTFKGPLYPRLVLGYPHIRVDSSQVDVDIDLPWYLDLLVVIPPLYLHLWMEIEGTVPDLTRRGLAFAMSQALSDLATGTQLKGLAVQGVTLDAFPDHSIVEDGCIALFAQVLVSPITENIAVGSYSKLRRRFEVFKLTSGRRFRAKHLAQLVQRGKVITPDYHDVNGQYMRANPDTTEANNLLERFKR